MCIIHGAFDTVILTARPSKDLFDLKRQCFVRPHMRVRDRLNEISSGYFQICVYSRTRSVKSPGVDYVTVGKFRG